MKSKLVYFLGILVLAMSYCNKGKEDYLHVLTGRLEIAEPCGNSTFSILQGDPGNSLSQNTWVNPVDGHLYHHVFKVLNICDFPFDRLKAGQVFTFRLTPEQAQNCLQCAVFYPTPDKGLAITLAGN